MSPQPCQGIEVWRWNYVLGGDGRERKSEETRFYTSMLMGLFYDVPLV